MFRSFGFALLFLVTPALADHQTVEQRLEVLEAIHDITHPVGGGIVHDWQNPSPGDNKGPIDLPPNYTATFVGTANSYSGYPRMFSEAVGPQTADHRIMVSANNGPVLRVRACAGGTTIVLVGGALSVGVEQRIDVTYDGAFVVAYIDGIQVQSAAHSGDACLANGADLILGGQPPGITDLFDGSIASVVIRDFAMTQAEIDADINAPPPFPPGAHVIPGDGTYGPGVVAAMPTAAYTGPMIVTTSGTAQEPFVIENVIIGAGFQISANHVTLRNVIINGGLYPIRLNSGFHDTIIEYSQILCPGGSKTILQHAHQNLTVRYVDASGCQALIHIVASGDLGATVIRHTYYHDLAGDEESHAEVFHGGSTGAITGSLLIEGCYFEKGPGLEGLNTGATAVLFSTRDADLDITVADNWISHDYGANMLRCNDAGATSRCSVRNNVWDVQARGGTRNFYMGGSSTTLEMLNNRWSDGSCIEQSYIFGAAPDCQ